MKNGERTGAVLAILALVFLALALLFFRGYGSHPPPLYRIDAVDPQFLETATIRKSYAEMIRSKADLSDFDCYACHEKGKPPPLRFDTNHNLIVPQEHADIVMGHGTHNRNNNCFNCHDEQNLELLQTRDGRQLKLAESPPLCGSCHGPTYRDWEAGAHGRTGGYWDRAAGPIKRQICVDCHDPHHPKIPPRKPAPGPHPLRVPASLSDTPTGSPLGGRKHVAQITNRLYRRFSIGWASDCAVAFEFTRLGQPRDASGLQTCDTAECESNATSFCGTGRPRTTCVLPCPGGTSDNSPAFQCRGRGQRTSSPEGTAENQCLSRPFGTYSATLPPPGVETPGYSQSSLRDRTWQILLASDCKSVPPSDTSPTPHLPVPLLASP